MNIPIGVFTVITALSIFSLIAFAVVIVLAFLIVQQFKDDNYLRNELHRITQLLDDEDTDRINDLDDLQQRIGEWAKTTFPLGTPDSVTAHFVKEAKEFADSQDPMEAADCVIMLLNHAYRSDYSLVDAIEAKFDIIQNRQWGEPDENGVVEHIRDGE